MERGVHVKRRGTNKGGEGDGGGGVHVKRRGTNKRGEGSKTGYYERTYFLNDPLQLLLGRKRFKTKKVNIFSKFISHVGYFFQFCL